jgi:hypothetical protein
MRWWVFLPAMAIALSLDVAFMPVLALGPFEPRLWPVVLAFCAMYASRESTLWAALVTGLWLDAAHATVVANAADPVPSAVPIIGPHVLACLAGAWPVLELRAVLYRRNVLAIAFAAGTCAAASALAFVALAGIRAAYADTVPLWGTGSGAAAVGIDLGSALYTAVLGLLPARLLHETLPAWDFATAGPRFAPGVRIGRDP